MLLMADNHKGYGMPVGGVAVPTKFGDDSISITSGSSERLHAIEVADFMRIVSARQLSLSHVRNVRPSSQFLGDALAGHRMVTHRHCFQ